jgi:DNA-binding LytR/AlgR family response regulator
MNLKCIIVDDEPVARKLLQEYVADISFLELAGVAENPLKATQLLSETEVDLMFLDINMPKMSGIDFLKTGARLPLTILTTAYADYAIEGFELDVLDYLVKPFSSDRFLKACLRAREYYESRGKGQGPEGPSKDEDHFFVKSDGIYEKVLFEELVYIEAMMNYVVLHTEHRKLIVYMTIRGILEQLPPDRFLKVNKSTIINTAKVKRIQGNLINLGQVSVTISQKLQESVMKMLVSERLFRR